jgi:glutathione peroxidase
MKTMLAVSLMMGVLAVNAQGVGAQENSAASNSRTTAKKTPLDVNMKSLTGKDINLAKKYEGKVIMLVNVASKCGFTPQYEQLQALHDKYSEQGLVVVGVPCAQFRNQEFEKAEDILAFCEKNYGVKFEMLAKVDVNGENACELYKYLTSKDTNPKFSGDIRWNFEKFIFNRDGQVVARYQSRVRPDAQEVLRVVEEELARKPARATTATGEPAN